LAVAANHGQRYRRCIGPRRNRAREIRQHHAFRAVSDLGERERFAGLQ
jgi:hypothetical protein